MLDARAKGCMRTPGRLRVAGLDRTQVMNGHSQDGKEKKRKHKKEGKEKKHKQKRSSSSSSSSAEDEKAKTSIGPEISGPWSLLPLPCMLANAALLDTAWLTDAGAHTRRHRSRDAARRMEWQPQGWKQRGG